MSDKTGIEWTDATFNPWVGCTKISAACDHCYAEGWAKRAGSPELWTGERRRTSVSNWKKPIKWNRDAHAAGTRIKVFCASLADVFDNQVPKEWRRDLFDLIYATPNLDWQLLTKRPQNIEKMLPFAIGEVELWPYPNVWLGTTVENQEEADRRIPQLLSVPAAVHFLSCEPLLGPIDLGHLPSASGIGRYLDALSNAGVDPGALIPNKIDWVIAGGESGPGARPSHPDWIRFLRDDCENAGVPFLFKQWGEWSPAIGTAVTHRFRRDGSFNENVGAFFGDEKGVHRIGKKRAGRLLDGIEHNGYPTSKLTENGRG